MTTQGFLVRLIIPVGVFIVGVSLVTVVVEPSVALRGQAISAVPVAVRALADIPQAVDAIVNAASDALCTLTPTLRDPDPARENRALEEGLITVSDITQFTIGAGCTNVLLDDVSIPDPMSEPVGRNGIFVYREGNQLVIAPSATPPAAGSVDSAWIEIVSQGGSSKVFEFVRYPPVEEPAGATDPVNPNPVVVGVADCTVTGLTEGEDNIIPIGGDPVSVTFTGACDSMTISNADGVSAVLYPRSDAPTNSVGAFTLTPIDLDSFSISATADVANAASLVIDGPFNIKYYTLRAEQHNPNILGFCCETPGLGCTTVTAEEVAGSDAHLSGREFCRGSWHEVLNVPGQTEREQKEACNAACGTPKCCDPAANRCSDAVPTLCRAAGGTPIPNGAAICPKLLPNICRPPSPRQYCNPTVQVPRPAAGVAAIPGNNRTMGVCATVQADRNNPARFRDPVGDEYPITNARCDFNCGYYYCLWLPPEGRGAAGPSIPLSPRCVNAPQIITTDVPGLCAFDDRALGTVQVPIVGGVPVAAGPRKLTPKFCRYVTLAQRQDLVRRVMNLPNAGWFDAAKNMIVARLWGTNALSDTAGPYRDGSFDSFGSCNAVCNPQPNAPDQIQIQIPRAVSWPRSWRVPALGTNLSTTIPFFPNTGGPVVPQGLPNMGLPVTPIIPVARTVIIPCDGVYLVSTTGRRQIANLSQSPNCRPQTGRPGQPPAQPRPTTNTPARPTNRPATPTNNNTFRPLPTTRR